MRKRTCSAQPEKIKKNEEKENNFANKETAFVRHC